MLKTQKHLKEKSMCNVDLKKSMKGITLIALVITIIVLLILAGVSIATLTGENGILTRANDAKEKTEEAEKDEKANLTQTEDLINQYVNGVEVEQVTDENPGVLETEGTDTYVINSIEDLVFFANDVTSENTYEGKTVKLGLNLDFNSTKSYVDANRTDYGKYGYDGDLKTLLTSGEGFKPIETWYGTFDGNGKVITNLYINLEANNQALRVGLFRLNYGTIKNFGLDDTNINVKYNSDSNNVMVGSICGYNVEGIIDSCYNNGNITLNETNSNGHYIGGISGNNNNVISNCYNKGQIIVYSNATNMASKYIGGISAQNTTNATLNNSINSANITAEYYNNISAYIGGIAGKTLNIFNCYNIGNINVENSGTWCHIGGVIGRNENTTIIENLYNTGNISYSEGANVGLICGYNIAGTIQNSKYLNKINLTGIGNNTGTDKTEGVDTIQQLPDILSILGDKFKLDSNGNVILYWQ